MDCAIVKLKSSAPADIKTEILYEIASARVSGIGLIKINFEDCAEAQEKVIAAATRILKSAKSNALIQFFATRASFDLGNTEAQFLINKYPKLFVDVREQDSEEEYIYIKI